MICFFFFLKVSCRRLRNKQLVIKKKNIAKISYLSPISQLWSTL